jgi:hypothetical protein
MQPKQIKQKPLVKQQPLVQLTTQWMWQIQQQQIQQQSLQEQKIHHHRHHPQQMLMYQPRHFAAHATSL